MHKRIFVEKKPEFAVEAQAVFADLRDNLLISNLNSVRIVNRYDIQEIEVAQSLNKPHLLKKDDDGDLYSIFAEPQVDELYQKLDIPQGSRAFAAEYLPGQYSQREDFAAQCLQILLQKGRGAVKFSKIYIFDGNIGDGDFAKIKKYIINPVDSHEVAIDGLPNFAPQTPNHEPIENVAGFIKMGEQELLTIISSMGLAMDIDDALFCQRYFCDIEKRDPAVTEIKMIDTYWSDHCRHTTFLTSINSIDIKSEVVKKAFDMYLDSRKSVYGDTDRPISLMDIATIAAKDLSKQGLLAELDRSDEINACSISAQVDVDGKSEQWLVMFKNETHNHPTEIEPFGGAATCLGGAIRDPLSGRVYVYQAMRVTGSADPRDLVADTTQGKLPQRKITLGAAHGYSSYGNQIGLATGSVSEIYHKGYKAKRMEIGAVIGAAPAQNVVREVPQNGDVVVLVGGRTGRDGCGGATGSSKAHTAESIELCGAEVQKGNPPEERKIQRLFRNSAATHMIKRCNDFGAGGVSVAIGELSDGIEIDLDAILKKYDGLDGTELAISESQERMAVVVAPQNVKLFIELANKENLEATVVAKINDSNRLVMVWNGQTVVDISRDFLNTSGAKKSSSVDVVQASAAEYFEGTKESQRDVDHKKTRLRWLALIADLNVCSKKGLSEMFDSTIGAGTVLMPFGGKNQLTPAEAMAAKIPVQKGYTNTCTIMSHGFDPYLSEQSPFHGAFYAVVESVSRIVASGGDHRKIYLTFQEYFEQLGSDSQKWGKPFAALLGAFYAQKMLNIAAIGGKDSMSGSFGDMHVPPTLVSFAVCVADARNITSPEFKKTDSKIMLFRAKCDGDNLLDILELNAAYDEIHNLILQGKVLAAHSVRSGGVAEAIAKMCFGNGIGCDMRHTSGACGASQRQSNSEGWIFSPDYGSIILEVAQDVDVACSCEIGRTIEQPKIILDECEISLCELQSAWEGALEPVFTSGRSGAAQSAEVATTGAKNEDRHELPRKNKAAEHNDAHENLPTATTGNFAGEQIKSAKNMVVPDFSYSAKKIARSYVKFARPRVLIATFPGTNCEYDTARAFEAAGAICDTFVFRNLTEKDVLQSIAALASAISKVQIVAIPGGFSAGDEPDGSGKFISTVFRNARVTEAVRVLLNYNDGLMIGICNGFQALIKLGLVPFGDIVAPTHQSPTLTYNSIGRHVSQIVRTRVASTLSPWMCGAKVGDIHSVPVSHGEGRFVAQEQIIHALAKTGQIATQYVDLDGVPSMHTPHNPNGSMFAVEGITSPDGRIFGKMGHSERVGKYLYKNIYGDFDQKIFASGVTYFK